MLIFKPLLYGSLVFVFSAMQMKPVPEVLRIPSSTWSGYGFSHSSPSAALKEQFKKENLVSVSDHHTAQKQGRFSWF